MNERSEKMKCPFCKGEGSHMNVILWAGIGGAEYLDCEYCDSTGEVSLWKWLKWHLLIETNII
jgi:formate dehydrogenase maturation protein FdhE